LVGGGVAPSARFGRPPFFSFNATGCAVIVTDSLIQCQIGAGTGRGLVWTVSVGGQVAVMNTSDTSSFQAPVLASFSGPGIRGLTSGSQVVNISGSNFGPISTPPSLISAFYSPPAKVFSAAAASPANGSSRVVFAARGCHVAIAHTLLTCLTAPGAGWGLEWSVVIDAQNSTPATTAYEPPILTAINCTTCPGPSPSSSLSPSGGDTVVLTGVNFGDAGTRFLDSVTYGPRGSGFQGRNCTVSSQHTEIMCFTSPGSGGGHSWRVTVAGQSNTENPLP